jgi:hypothetical protein
MRIPVGASLLAMASAKTPLHPREEAAVESMHKQRNQNNDRDRHAEKEQQ